jgi:hypothetical protein
MTTEDFRSRRARLSLEDFAISTGEDAPPSDLVTPATWRSMTSLPDDVSLRTSDHYGTVLGLLWNLWGEWTCLVGGLQAKVAVPSDSPIAQTACDATDYFQASIYNALTGHYRSAHTSLRAVVENMTLGMEFQIESARDLFTEWLAGGDFGFGWAADRVTKHSQIAVLESELRKATGDDLYRQRQPPSDEGGLTRRMFRLLSKYAHGAPQHTDADMWQSNGPIFVPKVFEDWTQSFLSVYSLAVLQSRLAQPTLDKLPWGASFDTRGLFAYAVRQLSDTSDARRLFEAVPDAVW